MISFVLSLAQATPTQALPSDFQFDWRHALVAFASALAPIIWAWWERGGRTWAESKLVSSGHPQAAETIEFLSSQLGKIATAEEKQALAKAAQDAGLDHPAINKATSFPLPKAT
jgi:hypothetical protein